MAVVLPGQPICDASSGQGSSATPLGGSGTYTVGSSIYASIVGTVKRDGATMSVEGKHGSQVAAVPEIGSTVVGIVTRISRPRERFLNPSKEKVCQIFMSGIHKDATVSIQTVDGVISHDFQGVIRAQDVRQTEKDKVKIWNCFRPGDIVRAQVLSLGDVRSYYLSTAANHLGVLHGTSESGNVLQAQSWESMLDPITNKVEARKVAANVRPPS